MSQDCVHDPDKQGKEDADDSGFSLPRCSHVFFGHEEHSL